MKCEYKTFESKIIYVFTIKDGKHEGRLKIGDATFSGNPYDKEEIINAARKRIDQYTVTADIVYELLYVDLAITKNGQYFRDYDVHNVLKRSGFDIETNTRKNRGREWFRISLDIAKSAIEAVKNGEKVLDTKKVIATNIEIIFRPEQEKAIEETIKAIKAKKKKKLWNAKMRFGKTLTALEVAKREKIYKTIIITHRPVVSDGWFEDFNKIFQGTEYKFGAKNKGEELKRLIESKKPFVYFASMQDLRGSAIAGGNFTKNEIVFNTKWDYVIIDEAHEGNKTEKAQNVHKNIKRDFTLELSGTPFNLIEEYENEDDIYTWDYVMEQKAKYEWNEKEFGDSNPYESLPKLSIFTYKLEKSFKKGKYIEIEDKAFNFKEFFRTYDEDAGSDKYGKFIHEEDVYHFLELITIKDEETNFPFSTEYYRENLKHTLWLVPGVPEAKALSELMKKHPIFERFDIVNVAGDGDEDDENSDALQKVKEAIGDEPNETYTITITCGKLTTGVSIPAWTAVMMLSNTNSAATYLQTAFRVQTPANIGGKMKNNCYVFDFAPDRTLKMVSQAARLNTKAGRLNSEAQKLVMGEFLNYCSIISLDDSKMKEINVEKLLRQLKKVVAERVASNGFDDIKLYNDELLKLDEVDIQDFNKLKEIIGQSRQEKKPLEVPVNNQGFSDEEWKQAENAEKKKKKQRTEEEEEALKRLQELKKQRNTMISILRGISIRIPMMIYGADIDLDKEITVNNFEKLIDDVSWKEFMPDNVTKELWHKFTKYYDKDIFIEAGLRIRRKARAADEEKNVRNRIIKIAEIFRSFKNPDKETILTDWKTVNRHMIDTLGGECFFDENFENELLKFGKTRNVKKSKSEECILKYDSTILEINSKSGLYPLLAAFNIYRQKVKEWRKTKEVILSIKDHFKIWDDVLEKNIFVIAKTPMAKLITERTLRGYMEKKINVVCYNEIIKDIKVDKNKVKDKIRKLFKEGEKNVDFDVIIGNPPYQEMDGGAQASASPIYQNFVQAAKELNPKYISLIMPSRWYTGGKGLDAFRDEMLNDKHIRELHDWLTPEDIFPNTNIRGGVCYFLWDKMYNNKEELTRIVTYKNKAVISDSKRILKIDNIEIFIRDYEASKVLLKIFEKNKIINENEWMTKYVSARKPFGLEGNFVKNIKFRNEPVNMKNPIKCYGKSVIGYVEKEEIKSNKDWIYKWKIFTAYANNIGTELPDDNFNTIIGKPGTVSTETYLAIGCELNLSERSAKNLSKFLKTKFSRFLLSLSKSSQHATRSAYRFIPVQNFENDSDIDWCKESKDIDKQLYKKYNFSEDEIEAIELKIKEM
ncbi:MAG: Eco57I restriction-modification methylase domain-containing protein [Clostridium sp.]|uniref:Eco57I restriction-modification methylase domain-containing protein n=1 Tax=Clostridium sp. TaxID=1506 RepID=UPI003F3A820B